ncbi:MAG TPA: hypothetical protein PK657_04645 [Legionella sp.]|nr:hypothetical protein [Legionella sp.]
MKKTTHTSPKKHTKEKLKNEELENVSGGSSESARRRNKDPFAPPTGRH